MVYAGGILVSQKQECNNAICIKADECRDYHTKLDMSEKNKYTHVESNFLKDTNELNYKTESDLQISKANLWLLKGKHWGKE